MNACTNCGRGLVSGRTARTTCQDCEDRILMNLSAVERSWPLLSDALEPTRGHSGPRVSGTPEHRLPAEQILNLIGPGGIPARMYVRYADLAVARGLQPAAMPGSPDRRLSVALRGIRRHLPWGVQAVDLRPLADETRRAAADIRAVTGETSRQVTVPCPAQLPDGGSCGGRLRYDRDQNTAHCRTCHTELDPGEWLEYWIKLGQPTPA